MDHLGLWYLLGLGCLRHWVSLGWAFSGLKVAQTWAILSPGASPRPTVMLGAPFLQALLVYSIIKYQPSEYGSYRFPAWAELLGILMGLLSCLLIPAGMLVAVLREEGSLWEVSQHTPAYPQPSQPVAWPWAHLLKQKTFAPTPYSGPFRLLLRAVFLTSSLTYESVQIHLS